MRENATHELGFAKNEEEKPTHELGSAFSVEEIALTRVWMAKWARNGTTDGRWLENPARNGTTDARGSAKTEGESASRAVGEAKSRGLGRAAPQTAHPQGSKHAPTAPFTHRPARQLGSQDHAAHGWGHGQPLAWNADSITRHSECSEALRDACKSAEAASRRAEGVPLDKVL